MQKKISGKGKVRTADPDDLDDILEIEKESSPNPWKRSFFEAEFTGRNSIVLVSEDRSGENINGFLVFRTVGDMSEINNIAVRRCGRRKGVAASLISYLKGIAVKEKVSEIFLEVRSANKPAINLYERSGFLLTGKRKNYYTHPVDDALIYKFEIG